MKKLFGILAIAIAVAACNKSVDSELLPASQANDGIIITATLAPKTMVTRAVADNGDNKITVSWAEDEHIAILYEVGGIKKKADAVITSVDGSGAATISFSVDGATPDNTPCTLVYPASAANADNSGVKAFSDLLAIQDGTLNASLDVRVGEGTIQTTTPDLTVTTEPAAQYAIFKFTLKKADESNLPVSSLAISAGDVNTMLTPETAKNVLYAALPAVSDKEFRFIASGSDNKTYTWSKPSISFSEGYYYQSSLKLNEQALQGSGTSGNPYLIYSKADWDALAVIVNGGTGSVHVEQRANINGVTTVVGTESKPFNGTYNGQGYTINNVAISGSTNVGLFGCVNDASAIIENVVVASGTVSGTSYNVGALVGQLNKGTVRYCANYASVSVSTDVESARCGGIVGWMKSNGGADNRVLYCINVGDITAESYAGGIVGSLGGGSLSYSQNYGTITARSQFFGSCGGIAGWRTSNTTISISSNHNGGNLSRKINENNYKIIACDNQGYTYSGNTYLSSLTLTINGTPRTGSDLNSYANGATAVSTNPTGIPIGGHYYAGPGAPAL